MLSISSYLSNFYYYKANMFGKYTKVKQDDIEEYASKKNPLIDLNTLDTTYTGLFQKSVVLIDNKAKYLLTALICPLTSFLSVYALFSENYVLFLLIPAVKKVINYITQDYYEHLVSNIRDKWKRIMFEYFDSLPYTSTRKVVLRDFDHQVFMSSFVFARTVQSIIPQIIELAVDCFVILYAIYMYFALDNKTTVDLMYTMGKTFSLIGCIIMSLMLYYVYVIKEKQQKLSELRTEMKKIGKNFWAFQAWMMHLFQNKKRTVEEIINTEKEINDINTKYSQGWANISNEYNLFCTLIVMVLVYFLSLNSQWTVASSDDWKLLLKNMSVFGQITGTVSMFTYITTNLETHMKDFDSIIDWIKKSQEQEPDVPQHDINFPLRFSSKITLTGESEKPFNLETDNWLDICVGDRILLKGVSGAGKTQLVNSLQGFVNGTEFNSKTPREYQQAWEYLNQQTREAIPSKDLTLRAMLDNESNDELIEELVDIVMLNEKFNSLGFDSPMEDLSGGEKMRLSIVYTLWNMKKRGKQVLILDEPEQGLDEETRVEVIEKILERVKEPVLVIYHGSILDLLKMSFNKVWLFDKKEEKTIVTQKKFGDYRHEIVGEISKLLEC